MHPSSTMAGSCRVAALACLFFLPFRSSGAENPPGKRPAGTRPHSAGSLTTTVPDACSWIPKLELEQIIGWELRDGKKKDVSPGMSQCDFTTPPGAYVTRRYPNPKLRPAAGFSSVIITTYPTSQKTFDENRRATPGGVRDIPGLGDDAFLYGPAMVPVRVGNRGFSIRLHVNEPKAENEKANLIEVLLDIARAGIAKL